MLDTLSAWTTENGMQINLQKCGFLDISGCKEDWCVNTKLSFLNSIPKVTSHKYLGLPVTKRGINWQAYIDTAAVQARATLNSVKKFSLTLPEWVKVHIVQTFIMPRIEYSAPLVWQWCDRLKPEMSDKQLKSSTDHPLRPFVIVREECLKWIFNTGSCQLILGAVAGLLDVNIRFSFLAASFARHLRESANCNPIQMLFPKWIHPPWPLET
jgi:hypothetical protein